MEDEGKVKNAIKGIVNGEGNAAKMTLIITHKIIVMRLCGRVIVLDQGSVDEEGTFDELMKKRGTFVSFWVEACSFFCGLRTQVVQVDSIVIPLRFFFLLFSYWISGPWHFSFVRRYSVPVPSSHSFFTF